ncbi:hypothetical protein [Aneurinibacillus migulanus]|nr:hypothetical protein [Aneurinibacillus migulanus]
MRPGKVITYQLSDEELAKYRNLPPVEGKRELVRARCCIGWNRRTGE